MILREAVHRLDAERSDSLSIMYADTKVYPHAAWWSLSHTTMSFIYIENRGTPQL